MSGAPDQIRSIVERILRLKDDQDAISDDIKEIYAEAKANGFDKTALGTVVGIKRKQAKDAEKFAEQDAIVQLYLDALDGPRTHTHEPAREAKPISERAKPPSPSQTAPQKDWRDEAVSAEMAGSQKIAFEPSHPVRVSDGKGGSYFMRYDDFMVQKAAADAARAA